MTQNGKDAAAAVAAAPTLNTAYHKKQHFRAEHIAEICSFFYSTTLTAAVDETARLCEKKLKKTAESKAAHSFFFSCRLRFFIFFLF